MRELLPCPFCGAEVSKGRDMWTSGNGWYIECSACKARSGVAWDTGKVVAAWNTRAETKAERDLRDEVNWLNAELHGAEIAESGETVLLDEQYSHAMRLVEELHQVLSLNGGGYLDEFGSHE